jgi:hypothetical protein
MYQLLDSNLLPSEDFKKVGTDIYVPYYFNGQLVYRYSPIKLESFDDIIPFNDYIANTVMATMLASRLVIVENTELSNSLKRQAEEYKNDIKTKQPAQISKKKDLYGSNCSF